MKTDLKAVKTLADFQSAALNPDQQKAVKGGDDGGGEIIIHEEIIDG